MSVGGSSLSSYKTLTSGSTRAREIEAGVLLLELCQSALSLSLTPER
jgi:hypothetical protein